MSNNFGRWRATLACNQTKTRQDEVTEETKEVVYDYWKMVASRPTGNKKDLIRKHIGVKTWVEHPKHMLEKTQMEAYAEFASMHPEIKISQRKFENLKPYFVRVAWKQDRETCMCHEHIVLQIVFKDCMKFRKRFVDESREANQAVTEMYTSVGNIIEKTLCPKPKDQILNWNASKGSAKTVEFPACFCYQRRKMLATTK